MSTARFDSWAATLVRCLEKKEMRGGHRQKEYADTDERMVEAGTMRLIKNIKEFEKHWY